MTEPRKGWLRTVGGLSTVVVTAFMVRTWVGAPMVVGSDAMAPALQQGGIVWLDRMGPSAAVPGAVVAYRVPGRGEATIKRVVGTEGQVVEISGGRLFLDGVVRGSSSRETWCGRDVSVRAGADLSAVEVEPGTVFVLGDDRAISSDSRQWGALPVDAVLGQARFVMWTDGARDGIGCAVEASPTH